MTSYTLVILKSECLYPEIYNINLTIRDVLHSCHINVILLSYQMSCQILNNRSFMSFNCFFLNKHHHGINIIAIILVSNPISSSKIKIASTKIITNNQNHHRNHTITIVPTKIVRNYHKIQHP